MVCKEGNKGMEALCHYLSLVSVGRNLIDNAKIGQTAKLRNKAIQKAEAIYKDMKAARKPDGAFNPATTVDEFAKGIDGPYGEKAFASNRHDAMGYASLIAARHEITLGDYFHLDGWQEHEKSLEQFKMFIEERLSPEEKEQLTYELLLLASQHIGVYLTTSIPGLIKAIQGNGLEDAGTASFRALGNFRR